MTAVFAVRHPQTVWNVEKRYQGRLEAPLSALGVEQSAAVVDTFAGSAVDAVVSSPLRRARDLAVRLARAAGAPLVIDQRLTEIGLGAWEGLFQHEIRGRHSELYERWYREPASVRFPHGEALADVQRRVRSALEGIFRRWPSGRVVLVSHTVVIQVLAADALDLDLGRLHRIRISNASVTTLTGSSVPGALLSLNCGPASTAAAVESGRLETPQGERTSL